MALNGIQIFKLTPKKNCKECGCPTCMAFSMKVAQGAMKIEQCPHMSDEALASLSEATAPPMKTIKTGSRRRSGWRNSIIQTRKNICKQAKICSSSVHMHG
jgi:CO dehydrogenase/acetyl-CoA synthase gamma subunit (corrinoid Fe-S protein)